MTRGADLVAEVVRLFDVLGVQYMITGSFVSGLYGDVRTTNDLDVVVVLDETAARSLPHALDRDRWYVDPDEAVSVAAAGGMFNIIDTTTGWKVDLMTLKPRPFSRSEFARRRRANLLGSEVWIASPEDTVLAKLEWAEKGGSSRQIEDAAGIVRLQRDLDIDYMRAWAIELGVETKLDLLLGTDRGSS